MPDSFITPDGPTYLGQSKYTVKDSYRLTVDAGFTLTQVESVEFTLTYPNTITPSGEIVSGGAQVPLAPTVTPGLDIPNRRVTILPVTPSGTDLVMTVQVDTLGVAPAGEPWAVRVLGLNEQQCVFEVTNGTVSVKRVVCDAHANYSGTPANADEGTSLILSAGPAVKTGVGAVVAANKVNVIGSPAPKERYRWDYASGPVTLGGDLPAVTETTTTPVNLPGSIFQLSPVLTFSLTAWLSLDGGDLPLTVASTPRTIDLPATAAPAAVTISHRPQKLMVVLDRTGSMFGDKWSNATTTARIMTDLFSAIRAGNPNDEVGILEFDDANCDWHTDPVSSTTKEVFPLTDVTNAWATICGQNLGNPGDCTNIGDALYVAYNRLTANPVAQTRYAVVLITDGLENAGHRRISKQTSVGSKPVIDYTAPDDLVISSIGIGSGSEVNTQALSDIAGAHVFHLVPPGVTDVKTLKAAATQSVAQLFGANGLTVTTTPSIGKAASAPANAGFFVVNGGEHRLAFAVETVVAADTVEIYRALNGEDFKPVSLGSLKAQSCPTHFFAYAALPALLGANAGSDTEWAIVLKHTPPVSDIDTRVLAWVDLRARADHVFDKLAYRTGEPMRVTVRLRDGHQPISGARVSVVMKRPKRSLGDFLARNSGRVVIDDGGIAVTTATHGDNRKTFGDTSPKFALYEAILQARGELDIGWEEPPGIFADGTNELHELGGTGNYSNVYTHTDKEGAVSFRFYVDGTLADGSTLSRVVLASKFVGVKIDPIFSAFTIAYGVAAPPGYQAVQVSFKPQDGFGNLLGPFHEAELNFVATSGVWSGDVVSELDGTYHRTLLYTKGDSVPIVTIETQGTSTVPLPVSRGCLGWLLRPLLWLLALILRLLRR